MYSQSKRPPFFPPPTVSKPSDHLNRRPHNSTQPSSDSDAIVSLVSDNLSMALGGAGGVNYNGLGHLENVGLGPDLRSVAQFLKDPYSPEFWQQTLDRISHSTISDPVRCIYEACLRLFPLSVRCWKSYLQQEISAKNFKHAKDLFERCLQYVLHIDLYLLYIEYVKTIHKGQENEFAAIQIAYEQVLDTIGYDVKSFPIWSGYIDFLKHIPVDSEIERKGKDDTTRFAYERALSLPIADVNVLGRQYEQFLTATIPSKTQIDSILKQANRSDTNHSLMCKIRDKHMNFPNGNNSRGNNIHGHASKGANSDGIQLRMPLGSDCDFPLPFPILAKQYNFNSLLQSNAPSQSSFGAGSGGQGGSSLYSFDGASFSTTSTSSSSSSVLPIPSYYTKYGTHIDPWVGYWKNVLNYERSNPQRVQFNVLRARVIYSFKKAMPYCLHSIQYWYDFVSYLHDELMGGTHNDPSSISQQHLQQGSTLYGLDTIYGNGFLDYTTTDESSMKSISNLITAANATQAAFANNQTPINPKYERENLNKSVFFNLTSRQSSLANRLQSLIYSTWELGLKLIGYSPLFRSIYINYATKTALPADKFVKGQIKEVIESLSQFVALDNHSLLINKKWAFYRKMNEEMKLRSEQLLFTMVLEAEHDGSIGTTMMYQLPARWIDVGRYYGDWRNLLNALSLPNTDLFTSLLNYAHTDGKVGLPITKYSGFSEVSAVMDGGVVIRGVNLNEDQDQNNPINPHTLHTTAILSTVGSHHSQSVIVTKEDPNDPEEPPQIAAVVNKLNINNNIGKDPNGQQLGFNNCYHFFLLNASTAPPSSNNNDTKSTAMVDFNDTIVTPDVTSFPLSPYLFSTVVNVLSYRTSTETLGEYPILSWLEHRRLSTDFESTHNLWRHLKLSTSPALFNVESWHYLCKQLDLYGDSAVKADIPKFYNVAKTVLLQKQRQRLEKEYHQQLITHPTIYESFIKKNLIVYEIDATMKYVEYLERGNDLQEAKNVITGLFSSQLLLTTDLDLVHHFTALYHKLLSLTVTIGATSNTAVLGDKGSQMTTCWSDLYAMQKKRAVFLNQTDNITVLHPTELQFNQFSHQSHQSQLQLLQIGNVGAVGVPGSAAANNVNQASQRGAAMLQQLLSASAVHPTTEQLASSSTSTSFMDSLDPLGIAIQGGTGQSVLDLVLRMGSNIPIESSFEFMSSIFPNFLSQLADPITLTTFKHLPSIMGPGLSSSIGGSGTGEGFTKFFNNGRNNDNNNNGRKDGDDTVVNTDLDSEAQALQHQLTQPLAISAPKNNNNRNNNNNMFASNGLNQNVLHHKAPILRKLPFDEQRAVQHVFTMPNLQRFTPYDPRMHSKLSFPMMGSFTPMVPTTVMKKTLVVDGEVHDEHDDDGNANQRNNTGVKMKVQLDPVNISNGYHTTSVLTQSETFQSNDLHDDGDMDDGDNTKDNKDNNGYVDVSEKKHKNKKNDNYIKNNTTVQLYNTTTSKYSQPLISSLGGSGTNPFIGFIFYNNFGLLANLFAGKRVSFSSNFLFLYKATLATIRSPQEIPPQLPTLNFKDVFYHQLDRSGGGGNGGWGAHGHHNPIHFSNSDKQAYDRERDQEYGKIHGYYERELGNIDRRATFVLLTQAIKNGKNNTLNFNGPTTTAAPQLAFTQQEQHLEQFSREQVADIILRSMRKPPIGAVIVRQKVVNNNHDPSQPPQQKGPSGPMGSTGPSGPMNPNNGQNGPMNTNSGPNRPMGLTNGPMMPMGGPNSGPNGPMGGPNNGPNGPNGPMGPMGGPMRPGGPGGPNAPMMGSNGPNAPMMGNNGPKGPNNMMGGPNGPVNMQNRPPFGNVNMMGPNNNNNMGPNNNGPNNNNMMGPNNNGPNNNNMMGPNRPNGPPGNGPPGNWNPNFR